MPTPKSCWAPPEGASLFQRRRMERGLSASALSKRIGVGYGTIVNWERCQCAEYFLSATRLLYLLGLPPADVCDPQSGLVLHNARMQRDLLVEYAAQIVGITPATLLAWERGKSWQQKARWVRYLAELGIDPEDAIAALERPVHSSPWAVRDGDSLLKRRRLEMELTQSDLSVLTRVAIGTIHDWEHGRFLSQRLLFTRFLVALEIAPKDAIASYAVFRRRRKKLGFENCKVLAKAVGVSVNAIYNWERGINLQPNRAWLRLLVVLDISPKEILLELTGETVSLPIANTPATAKLS